MTKPSAAGNDNTVRSGLHRNLSVWAALGLSVALLGPSMAANINPQAPAGLVGSAVPLVFVFAMVGVLVVAHSFARLSQYISSAGSVYGFIGATVGPRSGFVGGWLLLGTYIAFAACTAAGAALFLGGLVDSLIDPVLPWEVVGGTVVTAVGFLATRPAKAATTVLLVVEFATIALMLGVAVVVLVRVSGGGGPVGGSSFSQLLTLPDGIGGSALFAAMTFGFLSFAGFEAAATLGEETEDPRRTIPIALVGSVLLAGAFFVIVTSAEVLGFGTSAAGTEALVSSSSLVGDLARDYIGGPIGDLVTLGAGLSAFGSCLACTVGASRLLLAMGRDGFISTKLGDTDSNGVPRRSVLATVAVLLVLAVLMRSFATDDVVDIFFWTATVGSLFLLVAYSLSLVGAARFIVTGRAHTIPVIEGLLPFGGIAMIGYVLYRNVWPIPDRPYDLFPYIVAVWAFVGLLVASATPGLARRIGERLVLEDH